MKKNIKGQNFSADVLVVVIIVLFGALFLVINQINKEEKIDFEILSEQSTKDSKVIFDELKEKNIIQTQGDVNIQRLLQINSEDLKNELGIQGDFAIVFERDGKLVKLDPYNNINCIGSNNIIVNGVPCKS